MESKSRTGTWWLLAGTHVVDGPAAVLPNWAVLHSLGPIPIPGEAAVGNIVALAVVGEAVEALLEGAAVAAHGFLHIGQGTTERQHSFE